MIAFATGPGEVAFDGNGANRPYSGALAANILEEGIPIDEAFRRTQRRVLQVTRSKQARWEHSSLTGEFFFWPKMAEPEGRDRPLAGVDARHLAELKAREKIRSTQDRALLEKHVAAFPDGVFTVLALIRLGKLTRPSMPWASVVTGSTLRTTTRSDQVRSYEDGLKAENRATDAAGFAEAAKLYHTAAETDRIAGGTVPTRQALQARPGRWQGYRSGGPLVQARRRQPASGGDVGARRPLRTRQWCRQGPRRSAASLPAGS